MPTTTINNNDNRAIKLKSPSHLSVSNLEQSCSLDVTSFPNLPSQVEQLGDPWNEDKILGLFLPRPRNSEKSNFRYFCVIVTSCKQNELKHKQEVNTHEFNTFPEWSATK